MQTLLKKDLLQKYNRDGYLVFPEVLDPDLMGEAKEHVAWLIRKHPELRPENLHHFLVYDDPFWLRLVKDDRLLDIAEMFIGSNIALFGTHYICKPAFDGKQVLWHQDGSYWPLKPMHVISIWLAVDDSIPENGCMRVIPGTHKLEIQELQESQDDAVLQGEIAKKFVDESKAIDIVLKAGGVSIHHPNIIHGSKANHSDKRRCGLTIRYIPTTAELIQPGGWDLFLLRGEPLNPKNNYADFPKFQSERHMPFKGSELWQGTGHHRP